MRRQIWFDLNSRGKRYAYYWSYRAHRAFRMPLDEADMLIATGAAKQIPCHPFKGPRG